MAYLRDYFCPLNLTTYYPLPEIGWPWPLVAGSLLILLGVSIAVLLLRKHRPYLPVGWFWFLVMLLPVLGIVYYGGVHSRADRYTYLPQVGLSMALTWLVCDLTTALPRRRAVLGGVAGLLLLAMGFLSIRQAEHWSNTVALMTHELECVGGENRISQYYLGRALMERGSLDEAEKHLCKALEGQISGTANARNALGVLLELRGRTEEAISRYQEVLRIDPGSADTLHHLGKAHYGVGRRGEGIIWMERALGLPSVSPMILNDLAWMLATAPEENLRDGKRALELALLADNASGGADPLILDTLAAAYAETCDYPKALETARRALELAERQGNRELSARLRNEIALYESGKPCRDPQ
jgi:Tfp pilus assembly protein PilF